QAAELTEKVVDAGVKAIYELEEWEKRLWGFIFADGLGVGPLIAQMAMHGLSNDAIKATGAQIEMQASTALSSALQGGDQVVAGPGVPPAADQCFLSIDLLRKCFKVPHPTQSAPIRFPTGGPVPPIPINLPVPWDAGVAWCHLPEFWMIDMRYHYPYG